MGTETSILFSVYQRDLRLKSLKPRMGTETYSISSLLRDLRIKIIKTPHGDGN